MSHQHFRMRGMATRFVGAAVAALTVLSCVCGVAGAAAADDTSSERKTSTAVTQTADAQAAESGQTTESGQAAGNGQTADAQDPDAQDPDAQNAEDGKDPADVPNTSEKNDEGTSDGSSVDSPSETDEGKDDGGNDGDTPSAEHDGDGDDAPSASAGMSVTTPGKDGVQGNVQLDAAKAGEDLPDLIRMSSDIFLQVKVEPEGVSFDKVAEVARATITGAEGVQFALTPEGNAPMPEGCEQGQSCIATQTTGRSVYFGKDQGSEVPRVYFPMDHDQPNSTWTYTYKLRMIHPSTARTNGLGQTAEEKYGIFFGRGVFRLTYTVTINKSNTWIVRSESERIVQRYGCEGSECHIPGMNQTDGDSARHPQAAARRADGDGEIIDSGDSVGLNASFATSSFGRATIEARKTFVGMPAASDRYGVLLTALGNDKDKESPTLATATPMPGRAYQPDGSDLGEGWFGQTERFVPFTVEPGSSTGTADITLAYLSIDVDLRATGAKGEDRWFRYGLCEAYGTGADAHCVTQEDVDESGIQYDLGHYELWIRGVIMEDAQVQLDSDSSYVLMTQDPAGNPVPKDKQKLDAEALAFAPIFTNRVPGRFSFTKQGENGNKLAGATFSVTSDGGGEAGSPLWFTTTGDGEFRYCPSDAVSAPDGDGVRHCTESSGSATGDTSDPTRVTNRIVTGSDGSATVTGLDLTDFLPRSRNRLGVYSGSATFTVTETDPAPGYELPDPAPSFTVTFAADGTVTYGRDSSQRWVAIGDGTATSCETALTGKADADAPADCPVTVTNAAFRFLKTDLDGRPLDGAVFAIRRTQGGTPVGGPLAFVRTDSGAYGFPGDGPASGGTVTALESGRDGLVTVANLPQGTYRVTETKAPAGYEDPDDGVWFDITVDAHGLPTVVGDGDGDGPDDVTAGCGGTSAERSAGLPTCVAQVRNHPQPIVTLPKTGDRPAVALTVVVVTAGLGGAVLYRISGTALRRRKVGIGGR